MYTIQVTFYNAISFTHNILSVRLQTIDDMDLGFNW